jgi:hypothetical protein
VRTKPALWHINAASKTHALAHVAIAKGIGVSTDKIEFVERMNNRYFALSGRFPAIDGEAQHAMTVHNIGI